MKLRPFVHGPTANLILPGDCVTFADPDAALAAAETATDEIILLCDANQWQVLADNEHLSGAADKYDVVHCGLKLGAHGTFSSICVASLSWFFIDPRSDRPAMSWKATPAFCIVRPELIRNMGGFDWAYRSADARMMDLAYRVMRCGGRVGHDSACIRASEPSARQIALPIEDEFLFILRHLNKRALAYVSCWLTLCQGRFAEVVRGWRRALSLARTAAPHQNAAISSKLTDDRRSSETHVRSISAIIPTLDRYEYLPRAIDSLLAQSRRPDEIIVVDQTHPSRRRHDIYDRYDDVHVIFLDEPGQSRARNAGINAASGDWCLLFEDDTVAWDELIAKHVEIVERSGASASTGVSLAPWKSAADVPMHARHVQLAEVLATGNALILKSALIDVGGLDLAFDRGPGADHDLGVRLYLRGHEIVFTPLAIQTHFKAPVGGMRTHGVWWRSRTAYWAPFPPATQIYTARRYYPRSNWAALYVLMFAHARRQHTPFELIWLLLSAPWRLIRAIAAAGRLQPCFPLVAIEPQPQPDVLP